MYKMTADQEQPCSSTAAQDRATQSPALRRTPTETVRNRRASESVQHRECRLAQESYLWHAFKHMGLSYGVPKMLSIHLV